MVSHLDKFIGRVNQVVGLSKGPFYIVLECDKSLLKILDLFQTSGFLSYKPVLVKSEDVHVKVTKKFQVFFNLMPTGRPIISKIVRLSKSSRRLSLNFYKLRNVYCRKNEMFYVAVSTSSKGLIWLNANLLYSNKLKFGGEPLFAIIL